MNTQEIRQAVERLLSLADSIYGVKFNLPEIKYTVRGRAAGKMQWHDRCCPSTFALNFNLRWIGESDFEQVVKHETAHYVQMVLYPYSRPHGIEWQRIIRKLGGKVERCHSYDTSNLPTRRIYSLNCICGIEHKVGKKIYGNVQRGIKYRCTKCKSLLTAK